MLLLMKIITVFLAFLLVKYSLANTCGNYGSYNDEYLLCCNGTLINKISPASKCCGQGIYDSESQVCCLTRPSQHFVASNKGICCGFDYILPKFTTYQKCCKNKIIVVWDDC